MSELYDRYPSAALFLYEDGWSPFIYLICLSIYRCCFYILSDPVESQVPRHSGAEMCVRLHPTFFPLLSLWSIGWSIVDVCFLFFFFSFSSFSVTFSSPLLVTIQSIGKN